ncbi:MAG: hypothetical protein V3T86_06115 [Planctomycetota bacterium]
MGFNVCTGWVGVLLLMVVPASAQNDDPFKGRTRDEMDDEGRVIVTVPELWTKRPPAGTQILSLLASSLARQGGHVMTIQREDGMNNEIENRERYLKYDSAKDSEARIQKIDDPFIGYRIDIPKKRQIFLRRFLGDGGDGLIITVVSGMRSTYEKTWLRQLMAIVASVRLGDGTAATTGTANATTSAPVRLGDWQHRVSLVVPGSWQRVPSEDAEVWLVLKSGSGTLTFKNEGESFSAARVLGKLLSRLKRTYASVSGRMMGDNPPRMLIKNRRPGYVQYVFGYEANGIGYSLTLQVKDSVFAKQRAFGDGVAETVVLQNSAYKGFEEIGFTPGELKETTYKKLLRVFGPDAAVGAAITSQLTGFEKSWPKLGAGEWRKARPVGVLVVAADAMEEESHHFGTEHATYDMSRQMVVATAPPDDGETLATWRGRLYVALARAMQHRDLPVPPPAWYREGVLACIEAAGRSGGDARAGHPELLEMLQTRVTAETVVGFANVIAWTNKDFAEAEKPDLRATAWGYTHLMHYGRGSMATQFKRWIKTYTAKKNKTVPEFDVAKFKNDKKELKKHLAKAFGE